MAVTPQTPDEAFLREVDEGVRRDQVASLWQRFGKLAIAVVVLFLAAVAGVLWWQADQLRKAGEAGEKLDQAVDKLEVGDAATARPLLDTLAKDGPGGYRPLAQMMQAADAATANDNAKAIRLLDAVAADASQPQPLRDAALIKSVRLAYDSLPPATVVTRLKDLSVPGNPWFGVAGEMTALAHLKAGETAQAKTLLTALVRDAALPASLRGRAAQLAIALGVDAATLNLPNAAAQAASTAPAAAPPTPAS
ncbi:MAG: tetratricopeptide repeat protein [Polymorphobacter sp.]